MPLPKMTSVRFVLFVAAAGIVGCSALQGTGAIVDPLPYEGAGGASAGGAGGGAPGQGGAPAGTGGIPEGMGGTPDGSGGDMPGTGGDFSGSGGMIGQGAGGTFPGTGGTNPGTGGTPVHTVGACDKLGPIDKWEDISPPQVNLTLHTAMVGVIVDPLHSGTLYAGTERQGLYKSADCGANWTKINTGRNGAILDTGAQWSMAIDPVDSRVIFTANGYGKDVSLFKSTNGGVDWDSVFPATSEVAKAVEYNFTQEVSMDPTDHRHLVVSFHANCKAPYPPGCMAETKDSGATWRIFKGPAQGWIEDARPIVLGGSKFLYVTGLDGLFYTADSGANWEKVGGGGGHQIYRAKSGSYYIGTSSGLMQSADGHAWTKIMKSPNGDAMMGDGQRIFTSWPPCCGQPLQPFFTTAEGDGTVWKTYASPMIKAKAKYFAYDPDHHVLYSSNNNSGLWRVVTQ
jgi:hypothetical protein